MTREQTTLRSKLVVPPSRPRLVARSRLINVLLAGLAGKLTLISAPAGSGKTMIVGELARRVERLLLALRSDLRC